MKANSNIAYLCSWEPLEVSILFRAVSMIPAYLLLEKVSGTSSVKNLRRGARSIIDW